MKTAKRIEITDLSKEMLAHAGAFHEAVELLEEDNLDKSKASYFRCPQCGTKEAIAIHLTPEDIVVGRLASLMRYAVLRIAQKPCKEKPYRPSGAYIFKANELREDLMEIMKEKLYPTPRPKIPYMDPYSVEALEARNRSLREALYEKQIEKRGW